LLAEIGHQVLLARLTEGEAVHRKLFAQLVDVDASTSVDCTETPWCAPDWGGLRSARLTQDSDHLVAQNGMRAVHAALLLRPTGGRGA